MTRKQFSLRMWFVLVGSVVLLSFVFVSAVLAALPVDTTIADFTRPGTDVGSCYVGPSSNDGVDGEVTLAPTLATDFSGGSLPAGWGVQTWATGAGVSFSAGTMIVDNAAAYGPVVNAPASIEYMAVVANALSQNAGFTNFNLSQTDFAEPWAFFGSWWFAPPTLRARTSPVAGTYTDTVLGSGYFDVSQRYKIDWTATGVSYFINDTQVDAQTAAIASMRPVMSEADGTPTTLDVDWLRMGPYAPINCTYESRLFDSGIVTPTWLTLITSTYVPANTALSFETRSGDTTDTSDFTWSNWEAVTGGSIASPGRRYLQYRALLTTTDSLATPRLYSVQPTGQGPTAVDLNQLQARANGGVPAFLFLALIAIGVLALIGVSRRITRARR
jgi:hypothetical protein